MPIYFTAFRGRFITREKKNGHLEAAVLYRVFTEFRGPSKRNSAERRIETTVLHGSCSLPSSSEEGPRAEQQKKNRNKNRSLSNRPRKRSRRKRRRRRRRRRRRGGGGGGGKGVKAKADDDDYYSYWCRPVAFDEWDGPNLPPLLLRRPNKQKRRALEQQDNLPAPPQLLLTHTRQTDRQTHRQTHTHTRLSPDTSTLKTTAPVDCCGLRDTTYFFRFRISKTTTTTTTTATKEFLFFHYFWVRFSDFFFRWLQVGRFH